MSHKIKTISIADLIVNPENYRFDSVASQKEAIDVMIENQNDKIYNIAKNIAENGLNPSERVIVSPSKTEDKKYIVLEGNRRIVALNLILNPDKIDGSAKASLKTKFKKLQDTYKKDIITDIECVVFDDPAEAEKWIKLKHTGENDGVGIVTWNAQQSARFREKVENESSLALEVIKLLKSSQEVSEDIKSRLANIKTSNLDRLLEDPDVQNLLGINVTNNIIQSDTSKEEVVKGLTQIVKDVLDPKFTVKNIYTKEDRENYIKNFSKASIPDKGIKEKKPWQTANIAVPPTKGSKAHSAYRRKLIPKNCVMSISNPKVNRIYRELQGIDATKFTNASAVLLRVFVELSCDSYIDAHKLRQNIQPGEAMKLKKKALVVVDHLVSNGWIKNPECKGIRTAVQNKDSLLGIDTMHAYIHNKNFSPIHKDLIITWDNIQVFMEKTWENIK